MPNPRKRTNTTGFGLCSVLAVFVATQVPEQGQVHAQPWRKAAVPYAKAVADRVAKMVADAKAALAAKDLPRAKQGFEQAYWLRSTPDLLYFLGQVAAAQGEPVTAFDLYRRYLDAAGSAPATTPEETEALRKQVASPPASACEVAVSGPSGSLLTVDERLLGVLPLSQPLLLTPGPHKFRLEKNGIRSASDPLPIPEGRTVELHLTQGTAGSLIAVVTLNAIGVLLVEAPDSLADLRKPTVTAVAQAARIEHTVFLSQEKLAAFQQGEPSTCLHEVSCRDRLAQKTDLRYIVRFVLSPDTDPGTVTVKAELLDVATGLVAAQLTESAKKDALPPALSATTKTLFQTALNTPRATLKVETTPKDAIVKVDGQLVGTTPFERLSLSGPRKLTLELRGYVPVERTLTLSPDKTELVNVELQQTTLPPPPPPPPPEYIYVGGESKKSRVARWAVGGTMFGLGAALVSFGGALWSGENGCADPVAPPTGTPCEQLYMTGRTGQSMVGVGIGLTIGGSLLLFLPGRSPKKILKPQGP